MAALQRDNQTADGILVEVNMGNGGYYEGFLMDICKNEGVIRFPYRLNTEEKYPFSSIRFPPMEATKESDLQKNMMAEVLVAKDSALYLGWFKCCINALISAFCEFKYLNNTDDNVDFAKITNIRKPNMNPPMSMDMLYVHTITIPEELRQFTDYKNIQSILKSIFNGSVLINYDIGHDVLVIISRYQSDILYAKAVENNYFKRLAQKFQPLQIPGKIDQELPTAKSGRITAEFTIPKNFLRGALGKCHVNLYAAENIKGVVKLIRSSNKFIIQGETEEAVSEARKLLEILTEYYPIPKNFMRQLVGRKAKNIYLIIKATGTLKIFIAKPENMPASVQVKEDDVILAIVGSTDAVKKAKILIDVKIAHIYEVQCLRLTGFRIQEKRNEYYKIIRKYTNHSLSTQTKNINQNVEYDDPTECLLSEDSNDDETTNVCSSETNLDMSTESNQDSSCKTITAVTETPNTLEGFSKINKKSSSYFQKKSNESEELPSVQMHEIISEAVSNSEEICDSQKIEEIRLQTKDEHLEKKFSILKFFDIIENFKVEYETPKSLELDDQIYESTRVALPSSGNLKVEFAIQMHKEMLRHKLQALKQKEKHLLQTIAVHENRPQAKLTALRCEDSEPNIFLPMDGAQSSLDFAYASGDMDVDSQDSTIIFVDDKTDSIGRQRKKSNLVDLLKKIGYKGPLLIRTELKTALKDGLTNFEFNRLIVYLTDELHFLKAMKTRVTVLTKSENWDVFSVEVGQFMQEIGCPYQDLLTYENGGLRNYRQRILLVKFLGAEVMCNQLLHNDCQKRQLEIYMNRNYLILNKNTICSILDLPLLPTHATVQALEREFDRYYDSSSSDDEVMQKFLAKKNN